MRSILSPAVTDEPDPPASKYGRRDLEFTDFYRAEHSAQVRRAILLVGSSETANDVVHDAMTAVYQRWDTIDAPGPYLNRAVLNGCRDVGRRRHADPTLERAVSALCRRRCPATAGAKGGPAAGFRSRGLASDTAAAAKSQKSGQRDADGRRSARFS